MIEERVRQVVGDPGRLEPQLHLAGRHHERRVRADRLGRVHVEGAVGRGIGHRLGHVDRRASAAAAVARARPDRVDGVVAGRIVDGQELADRQAAGDVTRHLEAACTGAARVGDLDSVGGLDQRPGHVDGPARQAVGDKPVRAVAPTRRGFDHRDVAGIVAEAAGSRVDVGRREVLAGVGARARLVESAAVLGQSGAGQAEVEGIGGGMGSLAVDVVHQGYLCAVQETAHRVTSGFGVRWSGPGPGA